jgi:hypothetical protein
MSLDVQTEAAVRDNLDKYKEAIAQTIDGVEASQVQITIESGRLLRRKLATTVTLTVTIALATIDLTEVVRTTVTDSSTFTSTLKDNLQVEGVDASSLSVDASSIAASNTQTGDSVGDSVSPGDSVSTGGVSGDGDGDGDGGGMAGGGGMGAIAGGGAGGVLVLAFLLYKMKKKKKRKGIHQIAIDAGESPIKGKTIEAPIDPLLDDSLGGPSSLEQGAAGAALAMYKELMDMAMTDGVLGAGESNRLATARAKHGVTEAQHDALLAELTSRPSVSTSKNELNPLKGIKKVMPFDDILLDDDLLGPGKSTPAFDDILLDDDLLGPGKPTFDDILLDGEETKEAEDIDLDANILGPAVLGPVLGPGGNSPKKREIDDVGGKSDDEDDTEDNVQKLPASSRPRKQSVEIANAALLELYGWMGKKATVVSGKYKKKEGIVDQVIVWAHNAHLPEIKMAIEGEPKKRKVLQRRLKLLEPQDSNGMPPPAPLLGLDVECSGGSGARAGQRGHAVACTVTSPGQTSMTYYVRFDGDGEEGQTLLVKGKYLTAAQGTAGPVLARPSAAEEIDLDELEGTTPQLPSPTVAASAIPAPAPVLASPSAAEEIALDELEGATPQLPTPTVTVAASAVNDIALAGATEAEEETLPSAFEDEEL